MPFLVEILKQTPIWVWFLLMALLALGLSSTRTRYRSHMTLIVPALVFTMIALAKLAVAGFDAVTVLGTFAGGVPALGLVALLRPARFTERLENGKYLIRGEWMSLIVILAVFVGNYAGAVLAAIQPELASAVGPRLAIAAINGFSAVFMAGRTFAHLRAGGPASASHKLIGV